MTRYEAHECADHLNAENPGAGFLWAAREMAGGGWEVVRVRGPRPTNQAYRPSVAVPPEAPHPGPPQEPRREWGPV